MDTPYEPELQCSPFRAAVKQKPRPFPWTATLAKDEGPQKAQMVLFGPFGRCMDLHTAQHQGPLRGKAWFVFYIFARSWGRRSCQETDP